MRKIFSNCLTTLVVYAALFCLVGWLFSLIFPNVVNDIKKYLKDDDDKVMLESPPPNKNGADTIKTIRFKEKHDFTFAVKLEKHDGCYLLPTKINGIPMKMMLDTGASNVSISLVEYEFFKRQNLLSDSTLEEAECTIANGETEECFTTKIDMTIGNETLHNIECVVMNRFNAPLLLGMNVLSKLGKISIDYNRNLLILKE